jgi:outer membrane protein
MPRILVFAALAAASAAVAMPGLAQAQTQPYVAQGKSSDWTLDIGAGAVYGFTPGGTKADQINVIPWASFNWHDRFYANVLEGVGYNVVKNDLWRVGVQLRPNYSGASAIDGIKLPGLSVDLTGYAYRRIGYNFSIGGRLMHDISGQTDGTAAWFSLGHQDRTPIGLLQTTLYTRVADEKENQAYYGIDAAQSAQSGLPMYTLGAGAQNAGLALLMLSPVSKHWAVGSFLNVETALGQVANSPLIQDRPNKAMAYRGGLIVVRRFGGDLR